MQFTIRSKLITGYITLLVSVTIAAIYGYYSLAKVVEGKKNIRFFSSSVILSNSIYQFMSEARQDQNAFIQSMNLDLAIAVTAKIAMLREKAVELEALGRKIKDFDQIEMARAIDDSAVVYLETFQSLVDSITRRDLAHDGSVRGQLAEMRKSFENELPIEMTLKLQLLENSNIELSDVMSQKSKANYFTESFRYAREANNTSLLAKLKTYQDMFVRLYFENANIDDLKPLMLMNAEMIELLVVDNVDTAQQELNRQFTITEGLEKRQKILSLLVTAITISAGLLVVFVFGAEALDLSKLNLELAAILEAIRDGIVAVNRETKVTLINQRAKDLLGLKKDYLGKHILELFPNSKLPEVMKSGIAHYDQEQQRGKKTVLTTRIPVRYKQETIGGIVCFREKEELSRLASELTHVNTYIDALRANNHEFKNRLQTIQGMVQLGKIEEVLSFIQSLQASHQQRISLYLENIGDPAVSAILLGKFNRANELGISLSLAGESHLSALPDYIDRNGVVSVIGNLVQNAIDAVRELKHKDKEIRVAVKEYPDSIYFSVEDNGPGIAHNISGRIFEQGFTTKKGQAAVDTSELGELGEKHIGMGLYIAKNHIISMGGMIQFTCENGTMFEVTIPKQPE